MKDTNLNVNVNEYLPLRDVVFNTLYIIYYRSVYPDSPLTFSKPEYRTTVQFETPDRKQHCVRFHRADRQRYRLGPATEPYTGKGKQDGTVFQHPATGGLHLLPARRHRESNRRSATNVRKSRNDEI